MQEGDACPGAARSGRLVHHSRAAPFQRLECGIYVLDFEGDMVKRRPATLDKAVDYPGPGGLEHLQEGLAYGEHALDEAWGRFGLVAPQTEQ